MVNETKDETKREVSSPAKRETFVVFAVLSATAATAFAIQAWMTFGFGDEVWGLPTELSIALIVALDLFAIMFMVLTYLLRGTGWPRGAATSVFIFAIGAQVAAAEMFGAHRNWSAEVRWFSAIPAAFLALSQEGVILYRTHRGRTGSKDTDRRPTGAGADGRKAEKAKPVSPDRVTSTKAEMAADAAPVRQRPPRPATPPAAPPPSSGKGRSRTPDPAVVARQDKAAAEVIHGGRKLEDVARDQRVSTRTVQNWMASFRERGGGKPQTPPEMGPDDKPSDPGKPQLREQKEQEVKPHG